MHNKQGNIIWLASYPKSGNTWFRIFLANLLQDSDTPADINQLEHTPIASSRNIFDETTGIPSSELTDREIENLRPDVYLHLSNEVDPPFFQKIHDAYIYTPNGKPLIPSEATRGVIYFVRNPLDVAVSFAHHSVCTIDKMIQLMNTPTHSFCARNDKLHNQLRQWLLTWSRHVQSWLDESDLPVCILRYEDMLQHPFATFQKAVRFAGLDKSDDKIRKAIRFSDIQEVKRQEQEKGFREKAPKAPNFFRQGIAGAWQEVLTQQQKEKIIQDHGEIMKRFDYI